MDVAVNARFLLPDRHLEGLGRYTFEVTDAMAAQHPDVTFHLLFDRPFHDRYLTRPNLRPHVVHPPARHPLLFLAWFEVGVARWLRTRRPDVFFSPDGFTTLRTGVPRVTTVHDLAFERYPRDNHFSHRVYYRRMTPRFVAASRRVLTVSDATKREIVACYRTDPGKIVVAHPGVVPAFREPVPDTDVQAARARHAGGADYFLFVGAIHPRKNLPLLLRAFDRYKAETAAASRLLLVGRQAWKAEATGQALAAMRFRSDVVLAGAVPDPELRALYAGALATVFVSRYEGFGMPIVEAMACGGPVITADASSMPEAAGGAALLVDPGDPAALADAMRRVAADERLRADLGRRGRQRAAELRWDLTAGLVWEQLATAASGG